jgi:hypothetical protein
MVNNKISQIILPKPLKTGIIRIDYRVLEFKCFSTEVQIIIVFLNFELIIVTLPVSLGLK